MALLKHFDYTPDEADTNVRFELRNQEPADDGEARIALTVVDLESDADDGENLTIQLTPPDLEGLIEALEQTLEQVAPSDDGGEEVEGEEEADEEEADEPEPEPERPARRTRASKRQQEEDEE
jgi:hypothetical protein